jgi:hypothetical protein
VLERADARLVVNSASPETLTAGILSEISVKFENRSRRVYPAAGAYPVRASYRWTDATGRALPADHEPIRTILPEDILPDQAAEVVLLVRPPAIPGLYRLRVTLVQEGVFWFDEVNASATGALDVTVRACSGERRSIVRSSWARRLIGVHDRWVHGAFEVPALGHRSRELARQLLAKDEELQRTERQLLAKDEELQRTERQLLAKDEELRRAFALVQETRERLAETNDQLRWQRLWIEGIQASASWRVTAPLRAGKRTIMRPRPSAAQLARRADAEP